MKQVSGKGNQYWNRVFQESLTRSGNRDLFGLNAVCYHPFPFIFKRVLHFFEFFYLGRILANHRIVIEGKKVLDIGCGGARSSYFFVKRGGSVTGIDYADNVIERNRKIFPEINFEKMDACNLGFPDRSFDLVSAFITLQHIPFNKKALALKEMDRVLKSAGYMIILEVNSSIGRIQGEYMDVLASEDWQNMFNEHDLALICSRNLHFFPLYGMYRHIIRNVYQGIKSIKSTFRIRGRNCNRDLKTNCHGSNHEDSNFKYKLYDIIERNILRVIACLSFPLEFISASNTTKGHDGSHIMYLLRKK